MSEKPRRVRTWLTKDFKKLVAALRRECPTSLPVKIRAATPEELKVTWPEYKTMCGDCWVSPKTIRIRIRDTASEFEAMDTLVHEWAHAMSLKLNTERCHSDAWGLAYAKCYRVWEDIDEPEVRETDIST